MYVLSIVHELSPPLTPHDIYMYSYTYLPFLQSCLHLDYLEVEDVGGVEHVDHYDCTGGDHWDDDPLQCHK